MTRQKRFGVWDKGTRHLEYFILPECSFNVTSVRTFEAVKIYCPCTVVNKLRQADTVFALVLIFIYGENLQVTFMKSCRAGAKEKLLVDSRFYFSNTVTNTRFCNNFHKNCYYQWEVHTTRYYIYIWQIFTSIILSNRNMVPSSYCFRGYRYRYLLALFEKKNSNSFELYYYSWS